MVCKTMLPIRDTIHKKAECYCCANIGKHVLLSIAKLHRMTLGPKLGGEIAAIEAFSDFRLREVSACSILAHEQYFPSFYLAMQE